MFIFIWMLIIPLCRKQLKALLKPVQDLQDDLLIIVGSANLYGLKLKSVFLYGILRRLTRSGVAYKSELRVMQHLLMRRIESLQRVKQVFDLLVFHLTMLSFLIVLLRIGYGSVQDKPASLLVVELQDLLLQLIVIWFFGIALLVFCALAVRTLSGDSQVWERILSNYLFDEYKDVWNMDDMKICRHLRHQETRHGCSLKHERRAEMVSRCEEYEDALRANIRKVASLRPFLELVCGVIITTANLLPFFGSSIWEA